MITVLSGRRIDAAGAKDVRFPLESINQVSRDITDGFDTYKVSYLISSAACGADLIALSIAKTKNIPFRIVLPRSEDLFRRESVTDRPGSWGSIYDEVIAAAKSSDSLIVLENRPNYFTTNEALFEQALLVRKNFDANLIAFVIWDGQKRSQDDVTADFFERAVKKKINVFQIGTI